MNRPLALRIVAFVVLLGLIGAFFSLTAPDFTSTRNLMMILHNMSRDGVTALGLTFVIVVRKADLSFPGVTALSSMVCGWLIAADQPVLVSIAGAIAVAAVCGAVSGGAVAFGKLPDMIVTIAVSSITYGLGFLPSMGATIFDNFMSSGFDDIGDSRILGVNEPVFIMFTLYAVGWWILHRTRYGRGFYATGENPVSARFAGIRVRAYVMASFVLCAVGVAWAGILHIAEAGAADVTVGGTSLLPAYASVFLGAALFAEASVPATLAGTLLIATLLNGFSLMNMPLYAMQAISGIVLVLAITAFSPSVGAAVRGLFRTAKEASVQP
jgi:simple sugar transport system permease protein/ribose transport system permease protein